METNVFIPGVKSSEDKVSVALHTIAHTFLLVSIGLLPLLFIPNVAVGIAYSKTFIVLVAALIAFVLYAFAFLRSGELTFQTPLLLLSVWSIPLAALVSALLSGDTFDSLIGNTFAPQTAAGLLLIAFLSTLLISFANKTQYVIRLFLLLLASVTVLGVFHIVRVIFGADVLSLGVFTAATSSPLGSWNDIALIYGLVIILILTAVEHLPLSFKGRCALSFVGVLALIMLVIINFSFLWYLLGFLCLALLMYSITKQRFIQTPTLGFTDSSNTLVSVGFSSAVFMLAVIAIIGGSAFSGLVSSVTNVPYVEVRPSVSATIDIARSVFAENVFTGIGPNRFNEAWRLYKDSSINETIFWSTDFSSGSGFIPTSIIENGLLGLLAWTFFIVVFIISGVKTLILREQTDRLKRFIGISSYISALYIWTICIIYTPSVAIILLGAVMTGIFISIQSTARPERSMTIIVSQNRSVVFASVIAVMLVVVSSVSVAYVIGRHFVAIGTFNQSLIELNQTGDIDTAQLAFAQSFALSKNDYFLRELALLQLSKLGSLASVAEPSAAQQQMIDVTAANAVAAINQAISLDDTESLNWRAAGLIYGFIATGGNEDFRVQAQESFSKARQFDPSNPINILLEAQLLSQFGNNEGARQKTLEAIARKRNYTDALFFLSQLDIAAGNVDEAIATTQAIVNIEPNNPARHYQLGVLLASAEQIEDAVQSFENALTYNPEFSNARYFLALSLLQLGDRERALAELRIIEQSNLDNEQLLALIAAVEQGDTAQFNPGIGQVTENSEPVVGEGEQVTVTEDPDTDLITPVNTIPDANESANAGDSSQ